MTTLREAAQQALEAWEYINKYGFVLADYEGPMEQAITALRAALEQPEQAVPYAVWRQGFDAVRKYKQQQKQPEPVADAMKTVIKAMQADPDYAWSWHCNVAMAFADAGGDPYTANQGAARFMRLLANVDPAHELPPHPPRREWRGLSEEEIHAALPHEPGDLDFVCARAVEAALRSKNHE